MITITWEQMRQKPFKDAIVAINNSREVSPQTTYRAGRICTACNAAEKKMMDAMNVLAKKYSIDVSKGEPPNDEQQKLFQDEAEKILKENVIEVKVKPFDWNEIFDKTRLSGLQLMALQPICENVPSDEEEV